MSIVEIYIGNRYTIQMVEQVFHDAYSLDVRFVKNDA